jgi:hypothetical protein
LSSGGAFWFVINPSDYSHGTSLGNRFGLSNGDYQALLIAANLATVDVNGVYKILPSPSEWKQYITVSFAYVPTECKPEFNSQKLDFGALKEGRKRNESDRSIYHSLRIGTLPTNKFLGHLSKQVGSDGKLLAIPPRINYLRAKQREFKRTVIPIVLEAVRSNKHLYSVYMSCQTKYSLKIKQLMTMHRSIT